MGGVGLCYPVRVMQVACYCPVGAANAALRTDVPTASEVGTPALQPWPSTATVLSCWMSVMLAGAACAFLWQLGAMFPSGAVENRDLHACCTFTLLAENARRASVRERRDFIVPLPARLGPATQAPTLTTIRGTAGTCTYSGCTCGSFESQYYRPALCMTCFHTIDVHFPGEWVREADADTGRVFFRSTGTAERLYAQPADASDSMPALVAQARVRVASAQLDGDDSAGTRRPRQLPHHEGSGSMPSAAQVGQPSQQELWSTFLSAATVQSVRASDGRTAEDGAFVAEGLAEGAPSATAAAASTPTTSSGRARHSAALGSETNWLGGDVADGRQHAPTAAAAASTDLATQNAAPAVEPGGAPPRDPRERAAAPLRGSSIPAHFAGQSPQPPGSPQQPSGPGLAGSPRRLSARGAAEVDAAAAGGAPSARSLPRAASAPLAHEALIPGVPTAVSVSALTALAIDVQALSLRAGGIDVPPSSASPRAATVRETTISPRTPASVAGNLAVAACHSTELHSTDSVEPVVSQSDPRHQLNGSMQLVVDPSSHDGSTPAAGQLRGGSGDSPSIEATAQPIVAAAPPAAAGPVAATPTASEAPTPSNAALGVDLSLHLAPVQGDPLLVNMTQLMAPGKHM